MGMEMQINETHMGFAIRDILAAVERYAAAYTRKFNDYKIGDDAVLGGDGILEILRGARVLLNGPLSQWDGGTLDRRILEIAEDNNLLDENGEL